MLDNVDLASDAIVVNTPVSDNTPVSAVSVNTRVSDVTPVTAVSDHVSDGAPIAATADITRVSRENIAAADRH